MIVPNSFLAGYIKYPMPIEYSILKKEPPNYEICPNCGGAFRELNRGCVQRNKRKWGFLWKQHYCAVICECCKEIVDWESPPPEPTNIIIAEIAAELKKRKISVVTHYMPEMYDSAIAIAAKNTNIVVFFDNKNAVINIQLYESVMSGRRPSPFERCRFNIYDLNAIDDAIDEIIDLYNNYNSHTQK